MKDALPVKISKFTSKEQMLFYYICHPDDESAKQAVMKCSSNTLLSYTKEGRSPKPIALKIKDFSPKSFRNFLYGYDHGEFFNNENKGALVDDLSAAYNLEAYEGDIFLWYGETFASILEEAKNIPDNRRSPKTRKPVVVRDSSFTMAQNNAPLGEKEILLPDKQQTEDFPYSSGDRLLLQEFTADYDGPMTLLLKEDYANALIDMKFPSMVQSLYTDKWQDKANSFTNPNLKSFAFSLLGELDNICKNVFSETPVRQGIRSSRLKIRNLYVKLHPELYAGSFPFEAFIDDWNDAEF